MFLRHGETTTVSVFLLLTAQFLFYVSSGFSGIFQTCLLFLNFWTA